MSTVSVQERRAWGLPPVVGPKTCAENKLDRQGRPPMPSWKDHGSWEASRNLSNACERWALAFSKVRLYYGKAEGHREGWLVMVASYDYEGGLTLHIQGPSFYTKAEAQAHAQALRKGQAALRLAYVSL